MRGFMNPIQFTDAAVAHIQKMLKSEAEANAFRLSIKKTGCSGFAYVPDLVSKPKADDLQFTAQNDLAVYIDPKAVSFLENIVVDFVVEEGQGLKQKRLVFINPKETGRCGCGESFTIE